MEVASANAALIVKAVNLFEAHEAVAKEMEQILNRFQRIGIDEDGVMDAADKRMCWRIRTALFTLEKVRNEQQQ